MNRTYMPGERNQTISPLPENRNTHTLSGFQDVICFFGSPPVTQSNMSNKPNKVHLWLSSTMRHRCNTHTCTERKAFLVYTHTHTLTWWGMAESYWLPLPGLTDHSQFLSLWNLMYWKSVFVCMSVWQGQIERERNEQLHEHVCVWMSGIYSIYSAVYICVFVERDCCCPFAAFVCHLCNCFLGPLFFILFI